MQHHFATKRTGFTVPSAENRPFSSACQTLARSDGSEATVVAEEHCVVCGLRVQCETPDSDPRGETKRFTEPIPIQASV